MTTNVIIQGMSAIRRKIAAMKTSPRRQSDMGCVKNLWFTPGATKVDAKIFGSFLSNRLEFQRNFT